MAATQALQAQQRLSWEEYLQLDKERYEIIDGEVHEMATPTLKHQNVLSELLMALRSFVKQNRSGIVCPAPYDIVIRRSPLRTRQPDLFFFSAQQLAQNPHLLDEPRTEIAPELVIEVLSPSDSVSVWRDKLHDYHQIGVREVWAVDLQNEEIEVLVWEAWGYRTIGWFKGENPITSQVLSGLELKPQTLFSATPTPPAPEGA
ncbi:MAG: Uma2 family endonuclease [Fimbriimonadales bacterium]|mgnify:FL=1|nr:Uma2 family endonuclease [Armatimonadota bacterium]MCX7688576.1 Uma2 family endonuclease [Fimbriimonadales bacterium]